MAIKNYKNFLKNIYHKFTAQEIVEKNSSIGKDFSQSLFNVVANFDGDNKTISHTDLRKLHEYLASSDTNKDGTVGTGVGFDKNPAENMNFLKQIAKEAKIPEAHALHAVNSFINSLLADVDRVSSYKSGVIDGISRESFEKSLSAYSDTEQNNLKDIYRFFSDDKTNGEYADFESSNFDRRSYINFGKMAAKYLVGNNGDAEASLNNMLTKMKEQANGMLDNCTIEDLQNFLSIESNYTKDVDSVNKFKFGIGESYNKVSLGVNKQILIDDTQGRSLDANFDNFVTEKEFSNYNSFVNSDMANQKNIQLSGECFANASVNALGYKLAAPVYNKEQGTYQVTLPGIIDPKTNKPIVVKLTTEEIAKRKTKKGELEPQHNLEFKNLLYGMAIEKVSNLNIVPPERANAKILANVRNNENNIYTEIESLISKFKETGSKDDFNNLQQFINEKINDPEIKTYTNLQNNLASLKQELSLISTDKSAIATAIDILNATSNENAGNRTAASNTLDEANTKLSSLNDKLQNLFTRVPINTEDIDNVKKELDKFTSLGEFGDASNYTNQNVKSILSKYSHLTSMFEQIENCKTPVAAATEYGKSPDDKKLQNVIKAYCDNFKEKAYVVDNQNKQKLINQINNFKNKLKSFASENDFITSQITTLDAALSIINNPPEEIELPEEEIETSEEVQQLQFGVVDIKKDNRTYSSFDSLNKDTYSNNLINRVKNFRQNSDAVPKSSAFKYELSKSSSYVSSVARKYNTIAKGGQSTDILQLLTGQEAEEVAANEFNGSYSGHVLALRGKAKSLLGMNYGLDQNSGHAVAIVSENNDEVTIKDTNSNRLLSINKSDLIAAGENAAIVVLKGKTLEEDFSKSLGI